MTDLSHSRLQCLLAPENLSLLTQIQRGIEKEGLRVTPSATIAQSKHPKALGSPLTHPCITTDYSEALLEFITPVFQNVEGCIDYLSSLHAFTVRQLDDEYLWPASMPCRLSGDESIPIAQYGNSNIGQMKHAYRQGLGNRYGRTMQSIAGIHYNFSMPDAFWVEHQKSCGDRGDLATFKSNRYFDLIRNFRRHGWLLIYLFGASPSLDKSFLEKNAQDGQNAHNLARYNNSLGLPYATSLRMSDLGYQSKAQRDLHIRYDDLPSYLHDLNRAIETRYPGYEQIGIKVNGRYRQLNSNILQIENEYYSEIRPKRVTKGTETPSQALKNRGVEYIEVRILDTNPLLPVGIDAEQIRFLDTFLLYCLMADSPVLSSEECAEIKHNQQRVALEGRNPALQLLKNGQSLGLKLVAKQLLAEMKPFAAQLDSAHQNSMNPAVTAHSYQYALDAQMSKVDNSALTPSAKLMQETQEGEEFVASMLTKAKRHQQYFLAQDNDNDLEAEFHLAAVESLIQQDQIEAHEHHSFDEFLRMQYSA